MQRYLIRRVLTSIPVFFGITVIMFFLINSAPGDPLVALLSPEAVRDEQMLKQIRHELGLDQPMPVRYAIWFGQMLQGNLGRSFVSGRLVSTELKLRLPSTLELMGTALDSPS
jgi:peptide/nickel transport system permease protein